MYFNHLYVLWFLHTNSIHASANTRSTWWVKWCCVIQLFPYWDNLENKGVRISEDGLYLSHINQTPACQLVVSCDFECTAQFGTHPDWACDSMLQRKCCVSSQCQLTGINYYLLLCMQHLIPTTAFMSYPPCIGHNNSVFICINTFVLAKHILILLL